MDEVDLIENRCKFCGQSYTSLWALNRHVKRDHTTPRDTSSIGALVTGILVAIVPAVILGAIVTWLAWDIKAHNAAVIVGTITTMAVMWQGGWIALIVGSAEER